MDAAPSETNARIKSTARIAIGIAITVVTLYVVYRDADPQQMLDAIGEFNLAMLLPFGLFYAVQLWAKTERWAQLLESRDGQAAHSLLLHDGGLHGQYASPGAPR